MTHVRSKRVRSYFPHFLDAEYAQALGPRRAATLVDHHIKLLALLGARICVSPAILADSEGAQHLVSDPDFRRFVEFYDPSFLRLEVDGDPIQTDRQLMAHRAWRRMQDPGWVSSSTIGTPAMVAAGYAALNCNLGDRERFEGELKKIAAHFQLSKEAQGVLSGTFQLFSWFGTSHRAIARAKVASSITYYDKLVAALEAPKAPEYDYYLPVLERVKNYLDERMENQWERSAVLRVLAADNTIDSKSKGRNSCYRRLCVDGCSVGRI
jgi:hypothetical protein